MFYISTRRNICDHALFLERIRKMKSEGSQHFLFVQELSVLYLVIIDHEVIDYVIWLNWGQTRGGLLHFKYKPVSLCDRESTIKRITCISQWFNEVYLCERNLFGKLKIFQKKEVIIFHREIDLCVRKNNWLIFFFSLLGADLVSTNSRRQVDRESTKWINSQNHVF